MGPVQTQVETHDGNRSVRPPASHKTEKRTERGVACRLDFPIRLSPLNIPCVRTGHPLAGMHDNRSLIIMPTGLDSEPYGSRKFLNLARVGTRDGNTSAYDTVSITHCRRSVVAPVGSNFFPQEWTCVQFSKYEKKKKTYPAPVTPQIETPTRGTQRVVGRPTARSTSVPRYPSTATAGKAPYIFKPKPPTTHVGAGARLIGRGGNPQPPKLYHHTAQILG